tara:strand:+ start:2204 stop:2887 length:684 start_codon:yes stop_codon:yes gene_type:complete
MTLKISDNDNTIKNEILNGQFSNNMSDHILYLPSFIDKDICKSVMNSLDNLERDDSTPYTDGLLNDDADTYFDPDIKYIDKVRDRIFIDGLKEYASKIRSFNWSYYNTKSFHCSEMIIRRYNQGSEFKYHHDDIIGEMFQHWFIRRQNILTCNFYFSDAKDYEGGDLVFTCSDKKYHTSVGDIIIFPSNWMFYHEVQKITKGKRYSGTVWLYYGSGRKMPNAKSKDW